MNGPGERMPTVSTDYSPTTATETSDLTPTTSTSWGRLESRGESWSAGRERSYTSWNAVRIYWPDSGQMRSLIMPSEGSRARGLRSAIFTVAKDNIKMQRWESIGAVRQEGEYLYVLTP